jgi:hypothetical protein
MDSNQADRFDQWLNEIEIRLGTAGEIGGETSWVLPGVLPYSGSKEAVLSGVSASERSLPASTSGRSLLPAVSMVPISKGFTFE